MRAGVSLAGSPGLPSLGGEPFLAHFFYSFLLFFLISLKVEHFREHFRERFREHLLLRCVHKQVNQADEEAQSLAPKAKKEEEEEMRSNEKEE